jgi:hypothetical protein
VIVLLNQPGRGVLKKLLLPKLKSHSLTSGPISVSIFTQSEAKRIFRFYQFKFIVCSFPKNPRQNLQEIPEDIIYPASFFSPIEREREQNEKQFFSRSDDEDINFSVKNKNRVG